MEEDKESIHDIDLNKTLNKFKSSLKNKINSAVD